MNLLSQELIRELLDAAVSAGLDRHALLGRLDPGFVASLPNAGNPKAQLLSDLDQMNRIPHLRDQSVPLEHWLQNAITMAGLLPQSEVFERALDVLRSSQRSERSAPDPRPRPPSAKSGPVKILFLGANPSGLTERALGREVREIGERLRAADLGDRFRIEHGWAVRASDLQRCLLQHQPMIVHFSGHGTSDGKFMVEDHHGQPVALNPSALARLFEILKDNIRCVVLNACTSKAQAEAIAQHIDCVVGMTAAIPDAAAITFSGALYQALGFGRSFKEAFRLGCNELQLEGDAEPSLPALICRQGVRPEEVYLTSAQP